MLPLIFIWMNANKWRLVRHDRFHCLRLRCCHIDGDHRAAAVAEDERRLLARCMDHRHRIPALLGYIEVVWIVHGAPRIGTTIIGDHLKLVGEQLRNSRISTAVAASAWNHEDRLPLLPYFVVEIIAFGRHFSSFGFHGTFLLQIILLVWKRIPAELRDLRIMAFTPCTARTRRCAAFYWRRWAFYVPAPLEIGASKTGPHRPA